MSAFPEMINPQNVYEAIKITVLNYGSRKPRKNKTTQQKQLIYVSM